MSTWNHRVIKKVFPKDNTVCFEIHEVFYSSDCSIESWTEKPVFPFGESESELREDIRYFLQAFRLPVLEEKEENGKTVLVEDTDSVCINSGHYFEFMDRSSVALDYIYQFVGSHPLLKKDDRLKEAYLRVEKELANLYQLAGKIEDENAGR
jgi:hypothetical protein